MLSEIYFFPAHTVVMPALELWHNGKWSGKELGIHLVNFVVGCFTLENERQLKARCDKL